LCSRHVEYAVMPSILVCVSCCCSQFRLCLVWTSWHPGLSHLLFQLLTIQTVALVMLLQCLWIACCSGHTEASLELADFMCRQITKEPAADSTTEAQHAGHSRSNAAKLCLSMPRQPEGTKLPFHQADMSKKGPAAPQSRPEPGLHANQQLTHSGADVSYQANGPALQSRAAQQVMQQRHARLQQATTPSPHTLSNV